MIWINPLIEQIEREKRGYKFKNGKIDIPILAFADDIALFTNNNEDMKKIFKIVEDFCDRSGMEISPTKSAYTENTDNTPAPLYKGKEITKLRKEDS